MAEQASIKLPNGRYVYDDSPVLVNVLYHQVQHYFELGMRAEAGMTVFDVGANIGMFAMEFLHRCGGDATFFCFEPAPISFGKLERTLGEQFPEARLKLLKCAASSAPGESSFYYRPSAPYLSSLDETCVFGDDEHNVFASRVADGDLPPEFRYRVPWWLPWLPRSWVRFLVGWSMRRRGRNMQRVDCRVTTVSQVIAEHDVSQIDVLKVDVEGNELEVLRGIRQEDWPKIDSVAAEVHDVDDRLGTITRMLEKAGLSATQVSQEDILRGTNVYGIWATRGHGSRNERGA